MSFVVYTPGGYVVGLLLTLVFLLVGFGYVVGSFLVELVKARVMLALSVAYWAIALFNGLFVYLSYYYQVGSLRLESIGLLWSMILVLCADITYTVKYFVKKRRTQS